MILTLGFGEIVRVFFLNFEPTGGPSGMGGIRPLTELWQVVWSLRASRYCWCGASGSQVRPRHGRDPRG